MLDRPNFICNIALNFLTIQGMLEKYDIEVRANLTKA
jgi:hypothetical protein